MTALVVLSVYLAIGLILSSWGCYRWRQLRRPQGFWAWFLVTLFWPIPVGVFCWHWWRGTL